MRLCAVGFAMPRVAVRDDYRQLCRKFFCQEQGLFHDPKGTWRTPEDPFCQFVSSYRQMEQRYSAGFIAATKRHSTGNGTSSDPYCMTPPPKTTGAAKIGNHEFPILKKILGK